MKPRAPKATKKELQEERHVTRAPRLGAKAKAAQQKKHLKSKKKDANK